MLQFFFIQKTKIGDESMKNVVYIGISGGVDSAASAAVLLSSGYDVRAVHLVLNENDEKAEKDARATANALGIEYTSADLRTEFSQTVIKYFIDEYKKGRTPNPCIYCNRHIKFGILYDTVRDLGGDYLATGHYALIAEKNGKKLLKRSVSPKDQSYFLSQVKADVFGHVIFPVGENTKEETRAKAHSMNLPVAEKKDSQEICFIKKDYRDFLINECGLRNEPGDFTDESGNVIGRHTGTFNYTIGQRKGIGAYGTPMYVSAIDRVSNTVVLAPDGHQLSSSFMIDNINYLSEDHIENGRGCFVKIRAAAPLCPVKVKNTLSGLEITTAEKLRAVTPGQFAALYDDEGFVICSGNIENF